MTSPVLPTFTLIGAPEIRAYLDGSAGARQACVDAVRRAYLTHHAGDSAVPHSSFLRLPEHPRDRIIALPAYLGDEHSGPGDGANQGVAGIKWISSWPGNTAHKLPRASAVLILNDPATGFPYACLESSLISATRTAASAVLGAELLNGGRAPIRVGFIGTGLIAEHVRFFLRDLRWPLVSATVFDLSDRTAQAFAARLQDEGEAHGGPEVRVVTDAAEVFAASDVVVIATVAAQPHLSDPSLLDSRPIVLHLSLRDLAPDLIVAAQNFTDDVEHALRENTSLELARTAAGHTDFLDGTVAELASGALTRDPGRAAVFSPFGLGVLDLAVGKHIFEQVVAAGGGRPVADFFQGVQ